MLTVHNVDIIGAEDKPDRNKMDRAERGLQEKHEGSNAALYGRLTYIILIATAGPYMKVFAMPIKPGAGSRQLVIDTLEVNIMPIWTFALLMHGKTSMHLGLCIG